MKEFRRGRRALLLLLLISSIYIQFVSGSLITTVSFGSLVDLS